MMYSVYISQTLIMLQSIFGTYFLNTLPYLKYTPTNIQKAENSLTKIKKKLKSRITKHPLISYILSAGFSGSFVFCWPFFQKESAWAIIIRILYTLSMKD